MTKDKTVNSSEKAIEEQDIIKVLQDDALAILGQFPKEPNLANNWRRLAAKLIDLSLFFVVVFFLTIGTAFAIFSKYSTSELENINTKCAVVENIPNVAECQKFSSDVLSLSNITYFVGILILTVYFIALPQTIGKQKMKVRTISQDNTQITILQKFSREILLIVLLLSSFISIFNLFPSYNFANFDSLVLMTMFFGNFRILLTKYAFHDQIARTKVVELN